MVTSPDTADFARALAREGAAVVIVGDPDAAGALAATIEDDGGRASVFGGDVTRGDDRAALAEMVAELFPT